jgi:hypothetical protein
VVLASCVSGIHFREATMIHTGDTLENPVTGERVTFLATAGDTYGQAVVIETVVRPDGFVAAAHVHPPRASASRSPRESLGSEWSATRPACPSARRLVAYSATDRRMRLRPALRSQ